MKSEVEILRSEIARLKKLVYKDHLTKLLNRRGFEESINVYIEEIKNNKPQNPRRGFIVNSLSLAIVDIDNFKDLNDKYGHPVGDKVIKHLSRMSLKNTRKSDIVGRWGGEEIVIALVGSELDSAVEIIENLQKQIRDSNFKPNYTVSAGVASINEKIKTFKKLYECADNALYEAKRSGKNKVLPCKI
jgi:diguanylate cyclase (GGDEF)-like protein